MKNGSIFFALGVVALVSSSAFALGDQWLKDATWVERKPHDATVPGFFMNLGPTGLRARLRELSFEVKHVFPDSPAAGKIQLEDVIIGVNGVPFKTPHAFGFDWKFAKHGYEGPMMDLGNAIESSESSDGVLTLKVKRGSQELDVKLQLRPLGAFSKTFPYSCKKSEQLLNEICEDLVKTEKDWIGNYAVVQVSAGLTLLASGKPEYLPICKRLATNLAKGINPTEPGALYNWHLAYCGIYLSEYYLVTRDASVLPAFEQIHKGFIFAQTAPGVYQHQKNWGGYSELGVMVGLVNTTWALMDKCGLKFDLAPYELVRKRVEWLTTQDGHVLYGRESVPNWDYAPIKPHGPIGPGEGTARGGAGMMGYYLSGRGEPKSDELVQRMGKYLTETLQYYPDTHACPTVGIQWMGLGLACGYPEGFRKVMDYHKGYFNLMRGYKPGEFFAMPCRSDACDLGFPYQFTSATVGLLLSVKLRKLQITGAPLLPCRLGGCIPQNYKGKMDTAYRAIMKEDYSTALKALQNPSADDAAAAKELTQIIEREVQTEIAMLDALEKAGDISELHARLKKAQIQFALLPEFKAKSDRLEEAFKQDDWKLELRLGTNYKQLISSLKRNKTMAYVVDLENFAAKNPESRYGKWALAVATEYRSSKTIKEPTVEIPASAVAVGLGAKEPEKQTTDSSKTASVPTEPKAKPAPAAPNGVSAESLAEYQKRLIAKAGTLLANGAKIDVWISNMGPKRERYKLSKVSDVGLVVELSGNMLPIPWSKVLDVDRAELAKSMAKEDDVEALLIAAVMQKVAGKQSESETLFGLASIKDPDAVKKAKEALGKTK